MISPQQGAGCIYKLPSVLLLMRPVSWWSTRRNLDTVQSSHFRHHTESLPVEGTFPDARGDCHTHRTGETGLASWWNCNNQTSDTLSCMFLYKTGKMKAADALTFIYKVLKDSLKSFAYLWNWKTWTISMTVIE